MRLALLLAIIVSSSAACSRFSENLALKTTSKILRKAQPSLQQEADYELARQAIPGALKTVEGFWVNKPDNPNLIAILTEGYCQYGTAFVEDDWEVAKFKKDIEAIDYHNDRSTKIFTRCLNYALLTLGPKWQKDLFGDETAVKKLLAETNKNKRFSMLFAGLALGSIVNHNLTRIDTLSYLPTVQLIMDHIIALDQKNPPKNLAHAALPYIALGMLHSARPQAMGGNPELARKHFEDALKVTNDRFLLARTLMAYRVGLATMNGCESSKCGRKFFHDNLKQVLETAPSVWPEQRLANEVAHRKARRYLSKEKELF